MVASLRCMAPSSSFSCSSATLSFLCLRSASVAGRLHSLSASFLDGSRPFALPSGT